MSDRNRTVRCGLIQCSNALNDESRPVAEIQAAMLERHVPLIDEAGKRGVQILCLQEIFNGPYFCPSQSVVFYNTAAVYDADGTYLGKYRKQHIPQVNPGFWEKFYFKPGNLGYPVFKTRYATIGVYICYDRHFPEGARCLGLNGAEIVFNPSATVAGLSQYLWKIEQPAHAVANGYFMGCINRVGTEAPWNIGKFYGSSYFVNPRGETVAQASEDRDELLVADLDLSLIDTVRSTWQFYRDRRPEAYGEIVKP
jgi:N-carbamoylputrescine amidase